MKVGDIVKSMHSLHIIFSIKIDRYNNVLLELKPLAYDSFWSHNYKANDVRLATDDDIKELLSYEVKRSYISNTTRKLEQEV